MTQKKTTVKIGICTGGGDCPGLNTAIRALVKAIDLLPDHESVGIFHSFDGLLASPPKTKQLRQKETNSRIKGQHTFYTETRPKVGTR